MKLKIKDAADFVGGKIYGDDSIEITNVAKIDEAKQGDLTFLYLPKYFKYLDTTKASAVLVKPEHNKTRKDISYIVVDDPNVAFRNLIIKYFATEVNLCGIDKSANIAENVKLGENIAIGFNVVLSEGCEVGDGTKIFHNTVISPNVKIGKNCLIYPNATIRENSIIGNNVIIHSGTVVGSDGFGYLQNKDGVQLKIPQIGNVILEDDVELGSNVSIDRAALGSTIIKKGTKIDNLVQIAHNVVVGEHCAISAQSGISGSTKLGNKCILGGQAGLTGHIELTDGVIIGAQSGVPKSISKPGIYFGYPAKELRTTHTLQAHIDNLPKYVERIKLLEEKITELENQLNKNNGDN
ncbi:MAG: UDP-3-O-(3-hydroxymyristoyl)glucosamine N-acyltransferase [Ignavibacteriales bacterium]|nr:UDP-3-O-(3-hydroxymyristoyl)glucosamine N-acyltransferase [Ignavibacteriales bacterium]